ncbi:hypothetical protein D918_04729 [Trichuris suis]|nr:hypothetical protein D918_04729 [Trichuris suis]
MERRKRVILASILIPCCFFLYFIFMMVVFLIRRKVNPNWCPSLAWYRKHAAKRAKNRTAMPEVTANSTVYGSRGVDGNEVNVEPTGEAE